MIDEPTRRRAIASGVGIGLAVVAGCVDAGDDPAENESNDDPEAGEPAEDEGDVPPGEAEPYDDIDYENPDGSVEFVSPENGEELTNPVQVELAVEDFELVPTEDAQLEQGQGHLHVLIDSDPFPPGETIPQEEGYVHLGDGGTETELDLDAGSHDLVAQASDSVHVAYDLTDEISVEGTGDGEGGDGGGNESDGGGGNESEGGGGGGNESDGG